MAGLALAFAAFNAGVASATEVYNGTIGCGACVYINDGLSADNQLSLQSLLDGRVAIVNDSAGGLEAEKSAQGRRCTVLTSSTVVCERLISTTGLPTLPLPVPFEKFVVFSGDGNDTIRSRNGLSDYIACGPGFDTVYADPGDYGLYDCEQVVVP